MAARGNRDDVVVATKAGAHPRYKGLSAATVSSAAEESLRRLRTDRIDLFSTHHDDETVEVEEFLGAPDEPVRSGGVRETAASDISPERLEASPAASAREGLARYVALQPHCNLVSRDTSECPLADVARRHDLAVLPSYALASGFLTGKYRPDATPQSARSQNAAKHLGTERGRRVPAVLDQAAEAHGAAQATVAPAWPAAQPGAVAPIAGARTVGQLPALLTDASA